jgi:DNA-binding NarL/FixJ family response regulator
MNKLPPLAAPPGLDAAPLKVEDDEYVILSYPLPQWSLPPTLTEAERDVALGLLNGDSYEAIAQRRGKAVRTVANQVASVFAKLHITSRAELAKLCFEPPKP